MAVRIEAAAEFPQSLLIWPLAAKATVGVDTSSIHLFRYEQKTRQFRPVWNSGLNESLGYIWAKVDRPGVYVPIGLPRDRLLQEAVRWIARERRVAEPRSAADSHALWREAFRYLIELPEAAVEELREFVARVEVQTGIPSVSLREAKLRQGGHVAAFPLPGDASLEEFRQRLKRLKTPPSGLPEETLFYPPDLPRGMGPPWPTPPGQEPWNGIDWRSLPQLQAWKFIDLETLLPWLFSQDWWMYQHDIRHSGHASGTSDINSISVHRMVEQSAVGVEGTVITKPCIVDGKIYVGSGRASGGPGGILYKIDLATGAIEGRFPTSGTPYYSWYSGIGGSPAVVGGRVYFTGVHGKVYCVDTATMTASPPHPPALWETDLSAADSSKNQPVNNPDADSWSGPLVVNGKVYVGCGEGEADYYKANPNTYGFIYCLDGNTGRVNWLFCTCKFSGALDNRPNRIPSEVAASWAASAGFTVLPDPPETGCAVWSSCAYDKGLNRIYVGTGNSQYPHTAQPDELYGSGLISLDADTGDFHGFFQPAPDDSYWPGDDDIDVPGSATVFTRNGQRVVAFGSKNGSFFLLDANTLAPLAKRQLLPRTGGSGVPGDRGAGIASVVPTGGAGENKWGVMGTPALHAASGRLFVGIGGYDGMHLDAGAGIDQTRTPFMRALDWNTLLDAWPTAVGADGVSRYTTTKPPMYSSLEVGLSSPAVVNDVVFVSTNKTGLYALDVATGVCLWSAAGLPAGQFALGPALYGNYVVLGAGTTVRIYKLPLFRIWPRPDLVERWPWPPIRWPFPWPPPPPPDPRPDPFPGPLPLPDKT